MSCQMFLNQAASPKAQNFIAQSLLLLSLATPRSPSHTFRKPQLPWLCNTYKPPALSVFVLKRDKVVTPRPLILKAARAEPLQ